MKKEYNIIIDERFNNKRLDIALTNYIKEFTRSSIKNHCKTLHVNGKNEKFSYKARSGDKVFLELHFDDLSDFKPENIPLDIIYEDDNYIVINKKYNMVVHPAKGNYTGTLINALLGMKKELSKSGDEFRPGIVHRLDKETSGLIIVAKNEKSHNYLSDLFKKRRIIKKYHAVVKGLFLPLKLKISNNIGRHPKNRKKMAVLANSGKKSITVIEKVKHYDKFSYLDINLKTGRTHQIRVHLSNYGFPILGDLIYGKNSELFKNIPLCLVAYSMSFYDIFSDKKLHFSIEDPPYFKVVLNKIKNHNQML